MLNGFLKPGHWIRVTVHTVAEPPFVPQRMWATTIAGRVFDRTVPPLLDLALSRVDVTELVVDHVNVARVVAATDFDAVLDSVNIADAAAKVLDDVDMPGLIRSSAGALGSDTVAGLRRQSASADRFLARRGSPAPGRRPEQRAEPATVTSAGLVSRVLAAAVDAAVVAVVSAGLYLLVVSCVFLIRPRSFEWPTNLGWSIPAAASVVAVPYLVLGWTTSGHTVGGALLGIRVSHRAGGRISAPRALARSLICLIVPVGLLWVVVDRRRRSLADVVLRTKVEYDAERRETVRSSTNRPEVEVRFHVEPTNPELTPGG